MNDFSNQSPTKQLAMAWRPGQIVTTRHLASLGISRTRASYLKSSGMLAAVGDGAFRKANESPTWVAGVEALQQQLRIDLHIGGRTALEFQGSMQYAPVGTGSPVWLFGSGSVPKWFSTYDWISPIFVERRNIFTHSPTIGIAVLNIDGFSMAVARRERAIMEAIHLVGKHHRFEELTDLIDGLTSLDAKILQSLLEACSSIKVKRVFLYLAHASGHAWFSRLDQSKFSLGAGKREVVKGGRLDPRYLITVPHQHEEPDV